VSDSLRATAAELEAGSTTARELVDEAIEAIDDPAGEGRRAFLLVDRDGARQAADRIDTARADGQQIPPLAGIPIAVKDLCDIEGQVTTAGSVVLADRPAAAMDAPVVARMRAAGLVPIGRTNMTEFAYSGLGLNAHYDTPRSPWDRNADGGRGRIPGGSSSGTAVAIADGMVSVGLGTDTGGSCRIPAAFCGIVGFKPTGSRVPLDGIVPLAPSLDSVGPLGRSVDCCAIADEVFTGGDGSSALAIPPTGPRSSQIRLAALVDYVTDGLDKTVAGAFQAALRRLSDAGVTVSERPFPELNELPEINRAGGLATAEAYHWHRELLAEAGDRYDQRVRTRIEPGANQSAADYLDVVAARRRLQDRAASALDGFDAFVLPTVAIAPPTIASFDDGDRDYYSSTNLLCLRNTMVGNFLDACAISVPITNPGEAPVGLMLMAGPEADHQLLSVAHSIESLLGPLDR
jgi:aspartyl-tRNA(Asn)/glutamyl-tRNA(Gln) amidotransferase subunit A